MFANPILEAKNVVNIIQILKDAILVKLIQEEKAAVKYILNSQVVILAKQILDLKSAANTIKSIHLVTHA
jgi:hypothetical protein